MHVTSQITLWARGNALTVTKARSASANARAGVRAQEITRQCTWRHKGAVSKRQCTWRRTGARDHAAMHVTSQRRGQRASYARGVIRMQEITRQCTWRHKGAVSKRQCTWRHTDARDHAAMRVTSQRRGQQAPVHVASYGCKRSRGNCTWRHKGAVLARSNAHYDPEKQKNRKYCTSETNQCKLTIVRESRLYIMCINREKKHLVTTILSCCVGMGYSLSLSFSLNLYHINISNLDHFPLYIFSLKFC